MVNRLEFALQLLGFQPALQVHTNRDTTRVRALDSRILYGDPSHHKCPRIINERRENADQKSLSFGRKCRRSSLRWRALPLVRRALPACPDLLSGSQTTLFIAPYLYLPFADLQVGALFRVP